MNKFSQERIYLIKAEMSTKSFRSLWLKKRGRSAPNMTTLRKRLRGLCLWRTHA